MPIHADWKSMVHGMKSTYCAGSGEKVCRDFTDGTSVCLCKKGWNVFFATLNKNKWSDTSPRPKGVSETIIENAIEETLQDFQDWYDETKKRKKRKRHKKRKTRHVLDHYHVIHNPTPSPPSLPSLRGRVGGIDAIRGRFAATVEKYTDEEKKEIIEWYEAKKKCRKHTVPVKRFEARTHPKPPKGKILKPNPIHIMPKHMQTETVDSYTVAKNTKDGQYYVVNIKKGVATDGPFATEELAKDCIKNLYIPKVKKELGIR